MDIILFILVLGINILIHEFAHFYFARKANILCHEFAIGMGPVLYQKKKGETVYSFRAIPLGGYVSMAGEEVSDFVKIGNTLGVNLDEDGNVKEIILNNESKYDSIGTVVDKDLYGLDNNELFITLNTSKGEQRFNVNKDAMYILTPKKKLQLSVADRSYENKTLWERFKVVIAGPLSNFLLAFIILFFLAFFIGKPNEEALVGDVGEFASEKIDSGDIITSINGVSVESFSHVGTLVANAKSDNIKIGINNEPEIDMPLLLVFQGLGFTNIQGTSDLVVGQVFGRNKDLKSGDIVKSIIISNNIGSTSVLNEVNTWEELIDYASKNSQYKNVRLKVLRENKEVIVNYANISSDTLNKLGASYVGYSIGIAGTSSFNILYPLYYPFVRLGGDMKQMWNTIVLLVSPNSGVGVGDLAGPIGIFSLVSDARSQGAVSFFIFVAFLSVNIGFLNLLPIPALDGGRMAFIIYEGITKKKVNKNFENILITITFVLLLVLMVVVSFQDILRLFR